MSQGWRGLRHRVCDSHRSRANCDRVLYYSGGWDMEAPDWKMILYLVNLDGPPPGPGNPTPAARDAARRGASQRTDGGLPSGCSPTPPRPEAVHSALAGESYAGRYPRAGRCRRRTRRPKLNVPLRDVAGSVSWRGRCSCTSRCWCWCWCWCWCVA